MRIIYKDFNNRGILIFRGTGNKENFGRRKILLKALSLVNWLSYGNIKGVETSKKKNF